MINTNKTFKFKGGDIMSLNSSRKVEVEERKAEENLKGTFISVMLLGSFIIVAWLGVWLLFLSR